MASIFADLPAPDGKVTIDHYNGINPDIRTTLEKRIKEAIPQAAPLAKYFKGETERDTARNIWNYLRKVIKYKQDPKGFQDLRMPRRFHAEKTGDCKSYSINAIALYKSIYPDLAAAPKYAAYEPGAKVPTHVYAVVKDRAGKNIIIDGCYNYFDSEKLFTLALPLNFDMVIRTLSNDLTLPANFHDTFDRLPRESQFEIKDVIANAAKLAALKHMYKAGKISLHDCISGIEEIEESIGKAKKTKEQKKAARKKRKKKAGLFFKKIGRGLAFITLAPIRGAFSAIIAMNVNGLASNMRLVKEDKDQTGWKKLMKFWQNVGGIPKALNKAIELGTKHKALWMGKKAHAKFIERAKAAGHATAGDKKAKEKWLRGLSGFDSPEFSDYLAEWSEENNLGIGIAPAVAAAALAMGASLLAGVIPIITTALKKNHPAQAASMEAGAEDLVDANKRGELKITEQMIDAQEAPDPGNEPENPDEQGEYDAPPTAEPQEVNGISGSDYVIFGTGDDPFSDYLSGVLSDEPLSDAASVMQALTPLFQTGMAVAGEQIQKAINKKPKLKKVLEKGETYADDYFTGQALKKAKVKWHTTVDPLTKYIPYVAGTLLVLGTGYALMNRGGSRR